MPEPFTVWVCLGIWMATAVGTLLRERSRSLTWNDPRSYFLAVLGPVGLLTSLLRPLGHKKSRGGNNRSEEVVCGSVLKPDCGWSSGPQRASRSTILRNVEFAGRPVFRSVSTLREKAVCLFEYACWLRQIGNMREAYQIGIQSLIEYPSDEYLNGSACALCAEVADTLRTQGDFETWRTWQIVLAGLTSCQGLPASSDSVPRAMSDQETSYLRFLVALLEANRHRILENEVATADRR